MGELETERDELQHFTASGRAGRRNALPEIEVESNDPAKLAERLSDLTAQCDDGKEKDSVPQPSTSKASSSS